MVRGGSASVRDYLLIRHKISYRRRCATATTSRNSWFELKTSKTSDHGLVVETRARERRVTREKKVRTTNRKLTAHRRYFMHWSPRSRCVAAIPTELELPRRWWYRRIKREEKSWRSSAWSSAKNGSKLVECERGAQARAIDCDVRGGVGGFGSANFSLADVATTSSRASSSTTSSASTST